MEERLRTWQNQLAAYALPAWDSLPELELYMDQVVLLLSRYLRFFSRGETERLVTPSIINNYVRMKIMPPPVKKRYGRVHIAYLLMICVLKQSLNIAAIQKIVPLELEENQVQALYTQFVRICTAASADFSQHIQTMLEREPLPAMSTTTAIIACLSNSLTDFLLEE